MNSRRQTDPPTFSRRQWRRTLPIAAAAFAAGGLAGAGLHRHGVGNSPAIPPPPPVATSIEPPETHSSRPSVPAGETPARDATLTVSGRDAAWEAAILKAAESDPARAMSIYARMPAGINRLKQDDLLGKLFAKHGGPALQAALRSGIGFLRCCHALERSGVREAMPFLTELRTAVHDRNRPLDAQELQAAMNFLGTAPLTDRDKAWATVRTIMRSGYPDDDTINALTSHGNAELGKLVMAAMSRPWDVARVRQSMLDALALGAASNDEAAAAAYRQLDGEPGLTQARRFAVATATRIALKGDEGRSLAWAGSLPDPKVRESALASTIAYLRGVSRLRPLRLVLSDPALAGNPELLESAILAAGKDGAYNSREGGDLETLRKLASGNPDVTDVLESSGIPGILERTDDP